MIKFGHFFFLLVLTVLPIQCELGPLFASVDNFGQLYSVEGGVVKKEGNLLKNWRRPAELLGISENSEYIAIAASNGGTWNKYNPAGILLSTGSDVASDQQIVTDSSWKCEGFENNGNARTWPANSDRINDIEKLVDGYENLLDAVELAPNLSGIWGTVENIQLGAQRIWFDGFGPDSNGFPPNNVICIKKL